MRTIGASYFLGDCWSTFGTVRQQLSPKVWAINIPRGVFLLPFTMSLMYGTIELKERNVMIKCDMQCVRAVCWHETHTYESDPTFIDVTQS